MSAQDNGQENARAGHQSEVCHHRLQRRIGRGRGRNQCNVVVADRSDIVGHIGSYSDDALLARSQSDGRSRRNTAPRLCTAPLQLISIREISRVQQGVRVDHRRAGVGCARSVGAECE